MTGEGLLAGKRILVTGVLTRRSLAYHAAARLQQQGAEIVLTGFGRGRRLTERAAASLTPTPDVIELDVCRPETFATMRSTLQQRWGTVDGALHAIAHAPEEVLAGEFVHAPIEGIEQTMRVSAWSLHSLAAALLPLLRADGEGAGASIVALGVDTSMAVPGYGWMGVAKAALNSVATYLTVHLGSSGIRTNVVACGPIATTAAAGIPGFDEMAEPWITKAPLGWSVEDVEVAAGPICFLLSDWSRGISGQVLRVDGGYSALR